MRTIVFTFLLTACLIHMTIAQPPQRDWDKRYGGAVSPAGPLEAPSRIIRYADHYTVCGVVNSDVSGDVTETIRDIGSGDYWIIKTDLSGNLIWDKRFGSNRTDWAYDVKALGNYYYVVGGSSSDNGGDRTDPIIGLGGATDYWVIKMDTNRNKIWDKAFGGTSTESCYQIIPLSSTRFMLLGNSRSDVGFHKSEDSRGNADFWLVKIDTAGNKLWDKTIGGNDIESIVSTNEFIQTAPDSFLMGASSKSGISGEKTEACRGDYDYWVVKIDSNGIIAWDKTYGGSSTDFLYAVQQTPDGGYILGGWSNSDISGNKTAFNKGGYDYWVVKIDAQGNKIWDETYGGSGDDRLYAIEIDVDGNILLGGYTNTGLEGDKTEASRGGNDIWLLKIDQDGNKIWDKSFGASGNDQLQSILVVGLDTYILAGRSDSPADGDKSQPAWGSFDFWIIKTKPGDPLAFQEITLKTQTYQNTVFLNWTDTQANDPHYAILRLKSQNPFVWDTLGYNSKTFYSDTSPKLGHNFYQICRVETDGSCLLSNIAQANVSLTEEVNVYPNPAQDFIIIDYRLPETLNTRLDIYAPQGEHIFSQNLTDTSGKIEINTQTWGEGVYFYRITNDENLLQTSKIVILK